MSDLTKELKKLKVGDLRERLEALGLETGGVKDVLIDRLVQHAATAANAAPAPPSPAAAPLVAAPVAAPSSSASNSDMDVISAAQAAPVASSSASVASAVVASPQPAPARQEAPHAVDVTAHSVAAQHHPSSSTSSSSFSSDLADAHQKRKEPEVSVLDEPQSQFVKKARSTALMTVPDHQQQQAQNSVSHALVTHRAATFNMPMRTSSLEAPTMLLEGHKGHIHGCAFDSTGNSLASCSFDKSVLLWNIRGECATYASLRGHESAVLEVHWSKSGDDRIFTASADKTAAVFDAVEGVRIKRVKDHSSFVNTCVPSNRESTMMLTGSDDCTAKLFDTRARACVASFDCEYPVCAVAFSADNSQCFTAGIEETIRVWDVRKRAVLMTLEGHTDTITGLSVSPDGAHLLSNAADSTLRAWDIRPYAGAQRCVNVFQGHQHNFEKLLLRCDWSADSTRVSAGSADRFVYVWDFASRKMLYKLPGHSGAVSQVAFHPEEPVIASCGQDAKIYLGEISP